MLVDTVTFAKLLERPRVKEEAPEVHYDNAPDPAAIKNYNNLPRPKSPPRNLFDDDVGGTLLEEEDIPDGVTVCDE